MSASSESGYKRQKHSQRYRHRFSHDSWPPTDHVQNVALRHKLVNAAARHSHHHMIVAGAYVPLFRASEKPFSTPARKRNSRGERNPNYPRRRIVKSGNQKSTFEHAAVHFTTARSSRSAGAERSRSATGSGCAHARRLKR
jgi:hypothetical protein